MKKLALIILLAFVPKGFAEGVPGTLIVETNPAPGMATHGAVASHECPSQECCGLKLRWFEAMFGAKASCPCGAKHSLGCPPGTQRTVLHPVRCRPIPAYHPFCFHYALPTRMHCNETVEPHAATAPLVMPKAQDGEPIGMPKK
jgi:hypothetical protein